MQPTTFTSQSLRLRDPADRTRTSRPDRRPAIDWPGRGFGTAKPLCYHRPRGYGSPMNTGFGAYFALFSEVGVLLLVTTLAGVAAGYWADQQLGTRPVLALVGFVAGAGIGT